MLVFGLIATMAVIYFVVLFWGLGRTLQKFEHPFAKLEKPQAAVPWDSEIWTTATEAQKARVILWVDVYRSKDGQLRALPSRLRPDAQDVLPKEIGDEGRNLKELLTEFTDRPIILNVLSSVDRIDTQVNDELADLKLPRVLVQSEYDNVMLSIKRLQPMWIYGTSASDRVRWNMFVSLGLAPAVNFTGDFYVTPLHVRNLPAMNAGILAEVNRRGLMLLMGPLSTVDEVRQAQAFHPNIFFVTSSEAFTALPGF